MEEVIETEALPELIEAVVVLIHDPADAQNFLRVANTAFPLPSALGHLKRIRRGADAGTCGAAPNNDSATIGASRTRLELLLCLSSDIADLASVAQKFSQEACATASVKSRRHTNSDDLAATLAPRLVEVPNLAPRQFPEEWTKWNAYWPLAVPKPQPPHRPTENEVQHAMDMIHQHLQPHYVRLQREAPHLLPIVAAIVDPSVDGARQVLATSFGFPGLCQSNVAGSAPYARMVDCGCTANGIVAEHPVTFVLKELANHQLYLRHGTNGEEVSTESSSMAARPYLANGLDLFVTHEPCVMCSMALVHSRIERVFFCYPNQAHGGLGSTFHVHSIPSLNHHFRAFHCFRAAELLKSAL